MMKEPLISIIIPTYNYGRYINATLDCVLNQRYINIEIIVIDDGSTDNTAQILNDYCTRDSRVKYFYQKNSGLSSARNLGVRNSAGEFIQFLDADDLISEFKLVLQVNAFKEDSRIDISYTKCHYFVGDQIDIFYAGLDLRNKDWMPKVCGRGSDVLKDLVEANIMPVNSPLISRRIFDKVQTFDEDFRSLEDWDFWLRCAFQNTFYKYLFDDRAYGLIRVHESSMSQDRSRMHRYELILRHDIEKQLSNAKFMNETEVKRIKMINRRKIKNLLSLMIANAGFFRVREFVQYKRDVGLLMFFLSYIKALNDYRKKI